MRVAGDRASRGACASCCAFLIALVALVTPYWLWASSIVISRTSTRTTTVGTGPYVASYSSQSMSGLWAYGSSSYWLYISDINDAACNASMASLTAGSTVTGTGTNGYNQFGAYGFCTGPNGTFQTPHTLALTQTFGILAVVFAGLSGLVGLAVPRAGRRAGLAGGFAAVLGFIFATVSYAEFLSSEYTKGLMNGSAGLLMPLGDPNNATAYATFNYLFGLYLGPGFWAMVSASLLLLFSAFTLCAAGRAADEPSADDIAFPASDFDPSRGKEQADGPTAMV